MAEGALPDHPTCVNEPLRKRANHTDYVFKRSRGETGIATREDIQAFASATLLESLVTLVPGACVAMSPDGRILIANKSAVRLYGHEPGTLSGMHVSDLYAPENLPLLPDELARAADGGLSFDSVHLRADGSRIRVRVRWKRGELSGREVLLATIAEHCEHVAAEEARFKSAAFDAALDSMIVHDRHGNVLHFNSAAAAAAGMPADEFSTIEPWGWVPLTHRDTVRERLEAIVETGAVIFETTSTCEDGTLHACEIHARLLDRTNGRVIVSVIRDISARKLAESAVERIAYHDVLTGLPNRLLLTTRAEQAMADTRRYGDLLGLAFIDLDRFKPVNDRIGHQGGDAVLTAIASRLVQAVRAGDTVARLGGDEFVILLPRLHDTEALEGLGEKLCRVVSEPVTVGDTVIAIDASVGLALFDPAEDGFSSLLSKADMAMYAAKRSGERWSVFDDSILR